jgi:hypothetical protein
MNADGTGLTRLTNHPAWDDYPAWSPDGTKIVFVSTRVSDNFDIYVMNADSTGLTKLTNHSGYEFNPAWSPDGTRIAFTSVQLGNFEIYVMNTDGTGQTNLTNSPHHEDSPVWSPDGTRIAFFGGRDGGADIYVMNADGTGVTRLTNNLAYYFEPAWSPDGTQIAFASDRDGNREIYVMNADGSGITRLTNHTAVDYQPDWQPLPANYPPVANAGPDRTVEAESRCTATVTLDGSGSTDPDAASGDYIKQYTWTRPFGPIIGTNPVIATAGWPLGEHTITLTVEDSHGATGVDSMVLTVAPPPSFTEVCNGQDDDCDRAIDESPESLTQPLTLSCYDGPAGTQGVGVCSAGTRTCTSGTFSACVGEVTPATEVCNGVDDNCDGHIDEGIADIVTGTDTGECQPQIKRCQGGSIVEVQAAIGPTAEVCDGVDNNCDGTVDDGIADVVTGTDTGECQPKIEGCRGGSIVVVQSRINPATETCDGRDNDCDGTADDGIADIVSGTAEGECRPEIQQCVGGVFSIVQTGIGPTSEVCDGLDNDCNEAADDNAGDAPTWYADDDDDGYGSALAAQACTAPAGYVENNTDCNDGSGAVYPGAAEICNAVDDDCDGQVDEGNACGLEVGPITAPLDPRQVNTVVSASAPFSDPDPAATPSYTAVWTWGDGTTSSGTIGAGVVNGSHTYTAPGVYTVTVAVKEMNGDGDTGQATFEFVVIYDPNGGFVTGGGWIHSPAGAYTLDDSLTGKASFGFVSKYQKGATVPTGQTQFQFHVAAFDFRSTSYQWLVVAGPKAQYKGSGTINDQGDYGFLLTANDGQVTGGGSVDRFRIKIWNKQTLAVIYDNQLGAVDDGAATDAIEGGSIVVHATKK